MTLDLNVNSVLRHEGLTGLGIAARKENLELLEYLLACPGVDDSLNLKVILRRKQHRSKGPGDVLDPWLRWERGQVGIWEFVRRRLEI